MRKLCFLSMDSLDGYVSDDGLAISPLRELGWEVETISWRSKTADWNAYEAVIVRTPWDYQKDPANFIGVLREIKSSKARLENPLSTIEWNLSKLYLKGLEEIGIRIVPTLWGEGFLSDRSFRKWQAYFSQEELIIKPLISATAEDTYRLNSFIPELTPVFAEKPFMVQPFMQGIIAEGEYSLFYFAGEYSHAILKSPKPEDFRVQEEHGGVISAVVPEHKLIKAAEKALAAIGKPLLYARADFVRDSKGEFCLMELELIEPALYLRMEEGAPARFAAAFDIWMKKN